MKKNPAEIAGTRYKDEKLMSRVQKTDGTSRCFAQMKTLNDSPYVTILVMWIKKQECPLLSNARAFLIS